MLVVILIGTLLAAQYIGLGSPRSLRGMDAARRMHDLQGRLGFQKAAKILVEETVQYARENLDSLRTPEEFRNFISIDDALRREREEGYITEMCREDARKITDRAYHLKRDLEERMIEESRDRRK